MSKAAIPVSTGRTSESPPSGRTQAGFLSSLLKPVFVGLWRSRVVDVIVKQWILPRLPPHLLLKLAVMTGSSLEENLELVPCLCAKDRASVDVGAHFGLYTYHMAKYSKCVYAFEPLPRFAKSLVRSFPRDVKVEAVALSDDEGMRVLRFPAYNPTMATLEDANDLPYAVPTARIEHIAVPLKTLDGYDLSHVGFIKIDVEGHELAVLRGAKSTLEREHPPLLIELVDQLRPNIIKEVTAFLAGFGYSGFFLHNKVLNRIETFDPAVLQRQEQLSTYGRQKEFIDDFVFLRPEHMGRVAGFVRADGQPCLQAPSPS